MPLHLKTFLSQSSCLPLPEHPMTRVIIWETPPRERLTKPTIESWPQIFALVTVDGPLPSTEFQFLSKTGIPSLPTSWEHSKYYTVTDSQGLAVSVSTECHFLLCFPQWNAVAISLPRGQAPSQAPITPTLTPRAPNAPIPSIWRRASWSACSLRTYLTLRTILRCPVHMTTLR